LVGCGDDPQTMNRLRSVSLQHFRLRLIQIHIEP
jgi:hypothetical protein